MTPGSYFQIDVRKPLAASFKLSSLRFLLDNRSSLSIGRNRWGDDLLHPADHSIAGSDAATKKFLPNEGAPPRFFRAVLLLERPEVVRVGV